MALVDEAALQQVVLHLNQNKTPPGPYPAALGDVLSAEGMAAAGEAIRAWPDYRPTPLRSLDRLAAANGLGRIWYKDEGERFGLHSFKALGGAYAVQRLVEAEQAKGGDPRALTVGCATDGNHGRAVAWGAQLHGCRCLIYLHSGVSPGREAAIARYGAEIRRVAGTYDDSVRQAAADAAREGWQVVSDTTYEGYEAIPRDVMHGYMVMAGEAIDQLPAGERPSHLFLQAGVGGLAAAVLAALWQRYGPDLPRLVVVEPLRARCCFETAKRGEPVVTRAEDTVMACLSAGEISPSAWRLLKEGAFAFLLLPDAAAEAAMRLLADDPHGDGPLVAGESGVAGLAALLVAKERRDLTEALVLNAESRVFLIGSEGATDPVLYEAIVGRAPGQVVAQ